MKHDGGNSILSNSHLPGHLSKKPDIPGGSAYHDIDLALLRRLGCAL